MNDLVLLIEGGRAVNIRVSGIAVASACAFLTSFGPAVANNVSVSNQPSVMKTIDTYSTRESADGSIVQAQEDQGGDATQAPDSGDDTGMPAAPDESK
jgi:hypothetical protein